MIRHKQDWRDVTAARICLAAICSALLMAGCATEKKPDKTWNLKMQQARDALDLKDQANADRLYLDALAYAEKEADDQHISASLDSLALFRYAQGKYPEAERYCARQIAVDQKRLGTNSMVFVDELARFAELEEKMTNYTRATELYGRAQEVAVGIRGSSTPLAGVYLGRRAHLYLLQGKKEEADRFYSRSVNFLEDTQYSLTYEDDILVKRRRILDEIARIRGEYAEFCEKEGRLKEAEQLLDRAIRNLESIHGKGCTQATPYFESLIRIQKALEAQAKQNP